MIKVAILGYGVVGSGASDVIRKNNEAISERIGEQICVYKILDIRDFPDSLDAGKFTQNADDIFRDDEISIVIETIGGAKIAYEFTERALRAGKHVITSNKELVAKHGTELLELAEENGVSYMFEASVGGGIPIIRPIQQCLAANNIVGIMGILNGTTNYILTKMRVEGKDFREALKEAQQAGYAEQDPTADIEGIDSVRKIAILSSLAYGEYVNSDLIPVEGITEITPEDMKYAEQLGCKIKLIAVSRKTEEGIYAMVSPVMLPDSHPLACVEDVFNGIMVRGDALGDAMFYGRGAGALPTASAVVADVIDCARNKNSFKGPKWKKTSDSVLVKTEKEGSSYFVCMGTDNREPAMDKIKNIFEDVRFTDSPEEEVAFIVSGRAGEDISSKLEELLKENTWLTLKSGIRFYK